MGTITNAWCQKNCNKDQTNIDCKAWCICTKDKATLDKEEMNYPGFLIDKALFLLIPSSSLNI